MRDVLSYQELESIVDSVRRQWNGQPELAILLGTGLGGLAERIEAEARFDYKDLPQMPVSTAASHAGELICGRLAGKQVIAFSGRLHCYEGYSAAAVVTPVRLAKLFGAQTLIMGSAVGGLNPDYAVGDIAVISDHINLMGANPLVGANDERLGPRWPDMYETYSTRLIRLAREQAAAQGLNLHNGVYAAVLGPNLETPAEYRMLRTLGADMVGMSTVPEAVAAVHAGMRTLACAIITDMCTPETLEPVNIEKIIGAASAAEPLLSELIHTCLEHME